MIFLAIVTLAILALILVARWLRQNTSSALRRRLGIGLALTIFAVLLLRGVLPGPELRALKGEPIASFTPRGAKLISETSINHEDCSWKDKNLSIEPVCTDVKQRSSIAKRFRLAKRDAPMALRDLVDHLRREGWTQEDTYTIPKGRWLDYALGGGELRWSNDKMRCSGKTRCRRAAMNLKFKLEPPAGRDGIDWNQANGRVVDLWMKITGE